MSGRQKSRILEDLKNKQYRKILLNSFHLNGHTEIKFYPQNQKLKLFQITGLHCIINSTTRKKSSIELSLKRVSKESESQKFNKPTLYNDKKQQRGKLLPSSDLNATGSE